MSPACPRQAQTPKQQARSVSLSLRGAGAFTQQRVAASPKGGMAPTDTRHTPRHAMSLSYTRRRVAPGYVAYGKNLLCTPCLSGKLLGGS